MAASSYGLCEAKGVWKKKTGDCGEPRDVVQLNIQPTFSHSLHTCTFRQKYEKNKIFRNVRLYRIGNAWESVIGVMVLIRKQSSSKPDKQVSANWKPDVGDDVRTQTTAWKKIL